MTITHFLIGNVRSTQNKGSRKRFPPKLRVTNQNSQDKCKEMTEIKLKVKVLNLHNIHTLSGSTEPRMENVQEIKAVTYSRGVCSSLYLQFWSFCLGDNFLLFVLIYILIVYLIFFAPSVVLLRCLALILNFAL